MDPLAAFDLTGRVAIVMTGSILAIDGGVSP